MSKSRDKQRLIQQFRDALDRIGHECSRDRYDRDKYPDEPSVPTLRKYYHCGWRRLKEITLGDTADAETEEAPRETKLSTDYKEDSGVIESKSADIQTVEDLLEYAEVDTEVWQVDRYIVNKWDMGYKDAAKQAQSKPLYQIKAWLKRKTSIDASEQIKAIISEVKEHAPAYPSLPPVKAIRDGYMLEIAIADLHIAKLAWRFETGEDYDIHIAQNRYLDAVAELVSYAEPFHIEQIVLPTGNDLLHVDGQANTTSHGTLQDVDSRWPKAFLVARKMLVEAIDRLALIAPVYVPIIPGNHDFERMFYLGDTLDSWYHNCDRVTVDNGVSPRKYVKFGNNLLGYTHGSDEKPSDLPLIMAREKRDWWSESEYCEWHIGHWHRKKETSYNAGDTYNGVSVRVIPALCSADAWHHQKGYVKGRKSAEAYLWHKHNGYAGHFTSNVVEECAIAG